MSTNANALVMKEININLVRRTRLILISFITKAFALVLIRASLFSIFTKLLFKTTFKT